MISLRSETRQGHPLSSLLFNTVLEVLARTTRQESKRKGKKVKEKESRKRRNNISLFAGDLILCIGNLKDTGNTYMLQRNLLETLNGFGNLQDRRSMYQNQGYFYILARTDLEIKPRKQFHVVLALGVVNTYVVGLGFSMVLTTDEAELFSPYIYWLLMCDMHNILGNKCNKRDSRFAY